MGGRRTEHVLVIDTTGAPGEATGGGTLVPSGEGAEAGYVEWVAFEFHPDAPASTLVAARFAGERSSGTVFTVRRGDPGAPAHPRKQAVDPSGNPMVGSAVRLPAAPLAVAVSRSDPLGGAVVVTMEVWRP